MLTLTYVYNIGFNGESPALPPPNLEYEDDEEDQVFVERPTDITLKDNDSLEEEIFTPDTPQDKEFITVVPSPAKYGPPPPVLDLDSSNNHEKSELSDNEIESEAVDIGIDIREQLESQSDSYLSSEESCSTRTEDSSLEWISHIGLFEYRHNTAEEDILNVEERIPYSELILKLQVMLLSIYLSIYLLSIIYPSIYYLSIYLSIYLLSIHLSIIYPSIYLSIYYLSIYLSILYIYLSIYLLHILILSIVYSIIY